MLSARNVANGYTYLNNSLERLELLSVKLLKTVINNAYLIFSNFSRLTGLRSGVRMSKALY